MFVNVCSLYYQCPFWLILSLFGEAEARKNNVLTTNLRYGTYLVAIVSTLRFKTLAILQT